MAVMVLSSGSGAFRTAIVFAICLSIWSRNGARPKPRAAVVPPVTLPRSSSALPPARDRLGNGRSSDLRLAFQLSLPLFGQFGFDTVLLRSDAEHLEPGVHNSGVLLRSNLMLHLEADGLSQRRHHHDRPVAEHRFGLWCGLALLICDKSVLNFQPYVWLSS
jgi:hypothetical protein